METGSAGAPALVEQGPQARQLGFRGVRALALRLGLLALALGALVLRLFSRGDQGAVAVEEADPVARPLTDDSVPESEGDAELLAPDASVLIGRDRLVEAARQTQSFDLPRIWIVKEVLRRAEDPGVEVSLLRTVLVRGGRGKELDDEVRQPPPPPPGDPDPALAGRIDPPPPKGVRSAEGPPRQSFPHLFRDLPGLLDGVVHEHMAAGVEIGPPLLGHDLTDQLAQEGVLQSVPLGLQGLSVVVDELEGQRRE